MINPDGGSYRFEVGDYKMDFTQRGWICPRCGRVNAPFMPFCICVDEHKQVTYTTNTETDSTAKETPLTVPEIRWCKTKNRFCEHASIWNECSVKGNHVCTKEYNNR